MLVQKGSRNHERIVDRRIVAVLLACTLTIAGSCTSHRNDTGSTLKSPVNNSELSRSTREELLAQIQNGMAVTDAVRQLEEAGCSCKRDTRNGRALYDCSYAWNPGPITTYVWQVSVYFDDGMVTEVDARLDGVGF